MSLLSSLILIKVAYLLYSLVFVLSLELHKVILPPQAIVDASFDLVLP